MFLGVNIDGNHNILTESVSWKQVILGQSCRHNFALAEKTIKLIG
jgi:hypothetical protein|tara:strand:+ start:99 stop:233 length:135 start_codon:yes stop_codon:yes gene_type:complete